MKALIIGGTSGFGKEVSDQFLSRGYDLITVSRSNQGYLSNPHYSCNVGDLDRWKETLERIKSDNDCLDVLACIVGFTRAKQSKELTPDDWNETLVKNLTYVALAFQDLTDLLLGSDDPRAITIGSQWSYKTGCDELVPYTLAKHGLRLLTEMIAGRNPRLIVNHYCMPNMDTPGYWEVRKTFESIGQDAPAKVFTPRGPANPKVVAEHLVDLALVTNESGKTFVIDSDGNVISLK